MGEADESETGSANLWSGPRKGAGRFFGHLCDGGRRVIVAGVDERDEQVLFDAIFDIKRDVRRVLLLLLEEDDDGREEDDEQ
ncbi:MAG: hypothetical protein ACRDLK_09605 [Gaiellaceae bacterium]